MDFENPEKEPKSLFPAVAESLLGVPAQTSMLPFPRKPLGKPTSSKGQSKGKSSKASRSSRSHSKSRTKHKAPSYEGGFY